MAEFKLPDNKRKAGTFLGLLVAGGIGLAVWAFLLPILSTIVWGTIELGIGVAVGAVLLYVLTNKSFWKRGRIILDALGEMLFKGFVEMSPFTIMEMQLDKSEQDRQDMKKQSEKLKGEEDRLKVELANEEEAMKLSAKKIEICKQKIAVNPLDTNLQFAQETASNEFINSKDFIDKVLPIYNDMQRLVNIVDQAYTKSGHALTQARNTVRMQRRAYDAVTAGKNAMDKALKAFTGDPDMNKAGAIALEALKKDISAKVGAIKNTIQITNQLMASGDLRDAAKIALAADTAEQLTTNAGFDYIPDVKVAEPVKLKALS